MNNNNHPHISAMTHMITCEDEVDTMRDDKYWGLEAAIPTPKCSEEAAPACYVLDQDLISNPSLQEKAENLTGDASQETTGSPPLSPQPEEEIIEDQIIDELSHEASTHTLAYAASSTAPTITHDWMIDSGCTNHMYFNKNKFTEYQPYRAGIQIVDGTTVWTEGRGTVEMEWLVPDGSSNIVSVSDVLHVPALTCGPFSNVKAAHIVPFALRPDIAEYMFGNGSGTRLDTSDNYLLMHSTVEQAFDNGCFILLPVNPTEVPILRWKIQMTNSAAVNRDMGKVTLKDIDGQEVIFKNDRRPASRFLYYHFVVTLLRNKRDRQPSWEKYFTELPTGRPFTTMGRYLRSSMLLALARSAGDPDAEEEARILSEGGEHTFVEEQKLDPLEEAEVAQLALGAYDVEDKDEDEDED